MQKYEHLNEVNKSTSHYLRSKVVRAKEALEAERPPGEAGGTSGLPPGGSDSASK